MPSLARNPCPALFTRSKDAAHKNYPPNTPKAGGVSRIKEEVARESREWTRKKSSETKPFALIRVIRGQICFPLLFVSICVHSWLAFTRVTRRLNGAAHLRYRQEPLRCGRSPRARVGGNADATGRTLASPRLQSSRIRAQSLPAKGDPVRL